MARQRTLRALALGTALALLLAACAAVAFDWISFLSAFQRAQIAAQTLGTDNLSRLLGGVSKPRPQRTFKGFSKVLEYPPRSGAFVGQANAYRVTVEKDWRSPLFGLRRRIVATATVMPIPTDRAGEARIAIVE
jgi:hypothetical protein